MKASVDLHRLITFTVFVLCAAILGAISYRGAASFDSFWHLKMGLDFLDKGLSPYVDHYSFTHEGQAIKSPPVVFQLILATLVKMFGYVQGFHLIKLVAHLFLLATVFFYFKQIRAHWLVVLCIVPAITFFIELRSLVRPELFSYPLIVMAFMSYNSAREEFTTKKLLPFLVLLLIWVNYHTPVFGYVIAFGLFFEKALHKIIWKTDQYTWKFIFVWGLIIFFSGFANPDASHFLINRLEFSAEWYSLISEYRSSVDALWGLQLFHALWALLAITVILLIANRQYGLVLVCLIVAFNAWKYARIVTPAALIILLSFSLVLSSEYTRVSIKALGGIYKKIGIGVVAAFSILSFYSAASHAVYNLKRKQVSAIWYPYDVVQYLKKYEAGGNILNQYAIGGYLAYYLAPEYRVYIDGRTFILYPLEFMKRYNKIFKSVDTLKEDIQKYNISFVLHQPDRQKFYILNKNTAFRPHFVGRNYILYSKNQPRFPVTGRMMMLPMCWSDKYQDDFALEMKHKDILPADSALLPVLDLLANYAKADDKREFFTKYVKGKNRSDFSQRLAAYMALNLGYHEQAASLFYGITKKETMDFLLLVSEQMKTGNYEDVEKILQFMLYGKWSKNPPIFNPIDMAIVYTLLDELRSKQKLEIFDDKAMDILKNEVGDKWPLPLPRIYPDSPCH